MGFVVCAPCFIYVCGCLIHVGVIRSLYVPTDYENEDQNYLQLPSENQHTLRKSQTLALHHVQ